MAAASPPKPVHPPDEAIGSLGGLPPGLRRAFTLLGDFAPLPEPGPGDWLAQNPEPGQTFDAFLRSPRHRPDVRRQRLYLLPLGDFAPGRSPALVRLREFSAAFFGLETEVLPALDLDPSALPGRRNPYDGHAQLDARSLLGLLERRLPAESL